MTLERVTRRRTVVREVPENVPYVSGTRLVAEEVVTTRLPRTERTLTHLKRYSLKEDSRDRVPNLDMITGRSRIGVVGRMGRVVGKRWER